MTNNRKKIITEKGRPAKEANLAVHVHDIVTDWSYALAKFLVTTLFLEILATFHMANLFLVLSFFITEVLYSSIMKVKC